MNTLTLSCIFIAALATTVRADEATVKLYKAQCATCHGVDGKGQTTAGKKLGTKDWTDGRTLNKLTDLEVDKALRTGQAAKDGKELMPSFTKLGDAKLKALAAYIRTFQK